MNLGSETYVVVMSDISNYITNILYVYLEVNVLCLLRSIYKGFGESSIATVTTIICRANGQRNNTEKKFWL